MAKKIKIGDVFNRLTVVSKSQRSGLWICLCACGNSIDNVGSYDLNNLRTKSCGCFKRDQSRKIDPEEVSFIRSYNIYRINARKSKRSFVLSKEQHKNLILDKCFYCGDPPSKVMSPYILKDGNSMTKMAIKHNTDYDYAKKTIILINGIDRKDNDIGYEINNCVACCETCNKMKLMMSTKEWFNHMKKILEKNKL